MWLLVLITNLRVTSYLFYNFLQHQSEFLARTACCAHKIALTIISTPQFKMTVLNKHRRCWLAWCLLFGFVVAANAQLYDTSPNPLQLTITDPPALRGQINMLPAAYGAAATYPSPRRLLLPHSGDSIGACRQLRNYTDNAGALTTAVSLAGNYVLLLVDVLSDTCPFGTMVSVCRSLCLSVSLNTHARTHRHTHTYTHVQTLNAQKAGAAGVLVQAAPYAFLSHSLFCCSASLCCCVV